MKRIFILVLASCLSTYITAQNTSNDYTAVRENLDNMFENLDKTKVPTGILLDYAVDRVDFSNHEGTLNDNNFVDLATYQDILYSLASAGVIYNPIGRVDRLRTFHM